MLTTELFVRGPKFVKVRVEARVALRPDAAFDLVSEAIGDCLDTYFDPFGWDFGADIYPTNVYGEVLKLRDQGVVTVEAITIYVDGRQHDAIAQAISLPPDALPYSDGHDIYAVQSTDVVTS